MSKDSSPSKNSPSITLYIVLAYAFTWACWIPILVIANWQGYLLPTIANLPRLWGSGGMLNPTHQVLAVVFSLAVYGPLLASLVATGVEEGEKGLKDLWSRIFRWRVNWKWYLIGAGIALFIALIPRLLAAISGAVDQEAAGIAWSLPLLVGVFLWQTFTSGLGEEPGWRGYLLPRLQARYGVNRGIWIVGLMWAVWHFPFTIFDTLSNMSGVPTGPAAVTLVLSLLGQTMSLIGMSYIYAWLINSTGSVFLAILFHGLSNLLPAVLLSGVGPSFSILMALMPWFVVFLLEKIYGKERFPGGELSIE